MNIIENIALHANVETIYAKFSDKNLSKQPLP